MTETQEGRSDDPASEPAGSETDGWAPPPAPPAMPPPSGSPHYVAAGIPPAPYGAAPYGAAPYGAAPYGAAPYVTPMKNDGYAVASLVCSLVGILIGLSAILGIIFGFVARSRIKRAPEASKGAGMALAGIIIGFVGIATSVAIALAIGLSSNNPSSNPGTGSIPSSTDTALARSEALAPSGYPSGWHAQGSSSVNPGMSFYGGMSSSDLAQFTACLGTSTADINTNPAEYAGQSYDDGNGGTLAENVEVFPTSAQAAADMNGFSSPQVGSCILQMYPDFGASVAKGVGSGATAGKVTASAKSAPVGGTTVHGVELAIPITYQGTTNNIYIDILAATKGRSEVVMHFSALGASPTTSLESQMMGAALGKLTA